MPTDIYTTTLAMYEILKNGGLQPGGLNFDCKVGEVRSNWMICSSAYCWIDAFALASRLP